MGRLNTQSTCLGAGEANDCLSDISESANFHHELKCTLKISITITRTFFTFGFNIVCKFTFAHCDWSISIYTMSHSHKCEILSKMDLYVIISFRRSFSNII